MKNFYLSPPTLFNYSFLNPPRFLRENQFLMERVSRWRKMADLIIFLIRQDEDWNGSSSTTHPSRIHPKRGVKILAKSLIDAPCQYSFLSIEKISDILKSNESYH